MGVLVILIGFLFIIFGVLTMESREAKETELLKNGFREVLIGLGLTLLGIILF